MKKPITVTVRREHGNSGDCILAATDANGVVASINAPGDCSAYSALTTVREFIERALNDEHEAVDVPPAPETLDGVGDDGDEATS